MNSHVVANCLGRVTKVSILSLSSCLACRNKCLSKAKFFLGIKYCCKTTVYISGLTCAREYRGIRLLNKLRGPLAVKRSSPRYSSISSAAGKIGVLCHHSLGIFHHSLADVTTYCVDAHKPCQFLKEGVHILVGHEVELAAETDIVIFRIDETE